MWILVTEVGILDHSLRGRRPSLTKCLLAFVVGCEATGSQAAQKGERGKLHLGIFGGCGIEIRAGQRPGSVLESTEGSGSSCTEGRSAIPGTRVEGAGVL